MCSQNDLSEHTCSSKFLSRFTCVCIEVIDDLCCQNVVRPSLFNARHQICLNISIISFLTITIFLIIQDDSFYKEFTCNQVATTFFKRFSTTNYFESQSMFSDYSSYLTIFLLTCLTKIAFFTFFTIQKLHILANYVDSHEHFRIEIRQLS